MSAKPGFSGWLTQKALAELFQSTKQKVSLHIQNIFTEKELREDSVVKESLTTAADGKNYATKFYNLDVIISVGFRLLKFYVQFFNNLRIIGFTHAKFGDQFRDSG